MLADLELLERYATHGCETSFRELVSRHVNLVYSTALRLVAGDEHLARDVSQNVFVDLASKAGRLSCRSSRDQEGNPRPANSSLAGWLYTSTRYAASKAVRSEQTRRRYEQLAQTMNELNERAKPDDQWASLRPVLDDAMDHLSESDRDAVVLRFFEDCDLRAVGKALGLTEEAARKRVSRAFKCRAHAQ